MLHRLGARAVLACAGVILVGSCVWTASRFKLAEDLAALEMQARQALWAIALLGGLLLAGIGAALDILYVKPAKKLAVDARAAMRGGQKLAAPATAYAPLPILPDVIYELTDQLASLRADVGQSIATATQRVEKEKSRLAAILHDLHEGVVVCNLKHQIVLYNQNALTLLHVGGELGLGRSLFGLVAKEPVLHIMDLMVHRPSDGLDNAPFITGTSDGRGLLQGRFSLIRTQGEITGYVITFNDVTEQVAALARRDALLRDILDGLQAPTRRLLRQSDPTSKEIAADYRAVLDRAHQGYRSLLSGWWPMTDIHSADLFDFVIRRLDGSGVKVALTGLPIWLHGDSHSLVFAIEALVRAMAAALHLDEIDLSAESEGGFGWICLSWQGQRVDDATLIAWQKTALGHALGGMTVLDVMRHHTREDLVEEERDGRVSLRIALSLGHEGQDRIATARAHLPPRPEFFDLDLLQQAPNSEQGHTRLRDLTYVVFDTETTGLRPTQGDQIVSIAGVRIVNGRILTGEGFNRIVNPGRPIPPESTKFHGLTDEMVADRPPISVVLPQFRAYAADAVLVAHNAAFDMKFLRLREAECHVRFDNAVLDTMLLSSYVDGSAENQSLDAIAERYGVTITDRHTAMGDALVTAALLLKLIDGLEAKGIETLDQAMTTLNMTMELHNRGQAFN